LFNSKVFCIIIALTAIVLGAAIYLQVQEMMQYDLLAKLDKKYLSGTFTGTSATEAPAADAEKKDDSADTTKKDDKE